MAGRLNRDPKGLPSVPFPWVKTPPPTTPPTARPWDRIDGWEGGGLPLRVCEKEKTRARRKTRQIGFTPVVAFRWGETHLHVHRRTLMGKMGNMGNLFRFFLVRN